MNGIDNTVLARIDELQLNYIDALDSRDMQAWLATFSEMPQASYVCTTAESVQANLPVALILDDCRARLEDRVTFVDKIWTGTYQEMRTRHVIQRTRCSAAGANRYEVRTNFIIAFSPSDTGIAEILATGVYQDAVIVEGDAAKFLSKKAVTDISKLPHYIVFPL